MSPVKERLATRQAFEYKDKDWWEWSVWIDGPADLLDSVDHVVYKLHNTFRNPVREVSDRSSKFRLETAGWGVFTIGVIVNYKDGRQEHLEHDLVLEYPDGTPTTA